MTAMIFQMVMALAFVLLLIVSLSVIYRKRQKGSGLINLVAYHSFGQKMGIAALKVGDEILVLGMTPTDIKLLKKIHDHGPAQQETEGIADKVKKLRRIKEEIS